MAKDIATLLDKGKLHFESREFCAAKTCFDKALRLKPNDDEALYLRGITFHALEDYQLALADLTAALKVNPGNLNAKYFRGEVLIATFDFDGAAAEFRKLVKDVPTYRKGYEGLGSLCVLKSDWQGAIREYTRSLERCGPSYESYTERAECLATIRRRDEALSDFSAAIKLDPARTEARRGRIELAQFLDKYDLVIEDSTILLNENRHDFTSLRDRATAYIHIGRFAESLADCNAFLAMTGEDVDYWRGYVYCSRGDAHRGLGKWEEAVRDYTTSLSLDDSDTIRPMYRRAAAFFELQRIDECISDLTKLIESGEIRSRIHLLRGKAFQTRGNHRSAITDFEAGLAKSPHKHEEAELCFRLAKSWAALGDTTQSETVFDRAVRIDGGWQTKRDW